MVGVDPGSSLGSPVHQVNIVWSQPAIGPPVFAMGSQKVTRLWAGREKGNLEPGAVRLECIVTQRIGKKRRGNGYRESLHRFVVGMKGK